MRRKLVLVTILALLSTGTAFGDRGRGGGHGGRGGGGPVVRDHRAGGGGGGGPVVVRDHRSGPRGHRGPHRGGGPRVKHVRVTNGRYVFPGGVVRTYRRPVHVRYRDRYVRPAIIVEHYDPVPGYVWMTGSWTWGGAEWVWTPGYWAVASEPTYYEPATVSGGVSVSAGISIR